MNRDKTDARFEETSVMTEDDVRLYVRIIGTGPDTVIVPAAVYLAGISNAWPPAAH